MKTGKTGVLTGIKGFTLIQVSIILTIASLVMVAVLPGYQTSLKSNSSGVTKMNSVMSALRQFHASNGRLPCPADPTMATGNSNYGVEAAKPGSINNCTGGSPAAAFTDSTNNVAIGMLPVKTLGLSTDNAFDGFGRDITYAVDTNATGCWSAQSLNGKVIVSDTGIIYNLVLALVSHGADGHGAWLPAQGTGGTGTASRLNASSTDIDQLVNAHLTNGAFPTATVSSRVTDAAGDIVTFVKRIPTSTFDDLIVYRSQAWNQNLIPVSVKSATIVSSVPANGMYGAGYALNFTLTFPRIVAVTGNPRLALSAINTSTTSYNIGTGNVAYAVYQSGSGTNTLTFQYTVTVSDTALLGISLASPVDMNGATALINPCFTFFTQPDLSKVLIGQYLYVANYINHTVMQLDMLGNLLLTIGTPATSGTRNNLLWSPSGVAADSGGNIWISEGGNDRVTKHNSAGGAWLMSIGGKTTEACSGTYATPTTCNYLAGHNACCAPNAGSCLCTSGGTDIGQLNLAASNGITFDATGNLWATDANNTRVQEFNSGTGAYINKFNVGNYPSGIAADKTNNVLWIAEPGLGLCKLERCNAAGSCTNFSLGCGGAGGQFYNDNTDSDYVAVDATGNVWASDENNCRVQKFDSSGVYRGSLAFTFPSCVVGGSSGPTGVAVDPLGNLWIANNADNKIYNVKTNGTLLLTVGGGSTGSGASPPVNFSGPYQISIGR